MMMNKKALYLFLLLVLQVDLHARRLILKTYYQKIAFICNGGSDKHKHKTAFKKSWNFQNSFPRVMLNKLLRRIFD